MGINSTEVSYGFGQMGSMFNDGTAAMTPPTNKVFVAITMLTNCTFDSSGGLKASNDSAGAGLEYIGTEAAAHNLSVGSETTSSGGGGLQVDVSNTFPKGVTIYGRWTEIDPAAGTCIAYIGD
mgnify:FL=1|tara:strand:- start:953 stop:1321 length:369 start_codon:yes stop_codon:yes gene_type:complete